MWIVPSHNTFIVQVKEDNLDLIIVAGRGGEQNAAAAVPTTPQPAQSGLGPVCKYINIELSGPAHKGRQATLLLENPKGEYPISFEELVRQVCGHRNSFTVAFFCVIQGP